MYTETYRLGVRYGAAFGDGAAAFQEEVAINQVNQLEKLRAGFSEIEWLDWDGPNLSVDVGGLEMRFGGLLGRLSKP